jgi:transcriptional regulator with XRE-family HTH domain
MIAGNERTPEGVGERLALVRRVYGLQQQEFAERATINASAYNQYERGKRLISISHAHRLCDVYALNLDWIYRGDPTGLRYQTVEAIKALRKHGASSA